MSIALNFSFTSPTLGAMFLGDVNSTLFTSSLTSYPVNVDTGNWAFKLSNLAVDDTSLGYNGYVTIATNSPLSVAPMAIFKSLVSLLPLQDVNFLLFGGLVATFNCTTSNFPTAFPNITYDLSGVPLVLTPHQYVLDLRPNNDSCIFMIGGSNKIEPHGAAYTLGSYVFNSTYSVFDMENRIFSHGLLVNSNFTLP